MLAYFVEFALARDEMTRLEESVEVAQCQWADVQLALLGLEGAHNEYRRHLDIEKQRHVGLEPLLCGLHSRLVDHTSSIDLNRGFFRHDVNHDLDVYLLLMFTAVRNRTACFRSATCSVVVTHSATLRKDVSSIRTHLDGFLAALALKASFRISSDALEPGDALPPS